MAFEPLQTDEVLDQPVKPQKDMDDVMLLGCGAFVGTSLLTYALVVWPYFAFQEANRIGVLLLCSGVGLAPALILGAFSSRKYGLPGACGFIAGVLVTAIFIYLRLDQAFLAGLAEQAAPPDYPAVVRFLMPLAWVLIALIVAVSLVPRSDSSDISG